MKINFINKVKLPLTKELKSELKEVIHAIASSESRKIYSVNMIFCNDVFIREYNKEYLGHDYETDIITFHDVNEKGETEGELLMSADTISENSKRYKTGFDTELRRVVIHGILHLCGYKDKTEKQKKLIRRKENRYLKLK